MRSLAQLGQSKTKSWCLVLLHIFPIRQVLFLLPAISLSFQRSSDSAETEILPESSAVMRRYKVSQTCLTHTRIKLTALEKRQMLISQCGSLDREHSMI